jgi:hypothetical protein
MAGPSLAELAAARHKVFGTAYRSTFAVDDPATATWPYPNSIR